ncbi:MAG: hypothetical protein OEV44_13360 [Spirochaetota bacterium]|nr:hypothetical protein [Spirochaetota bacterium]
MNQKVIMTVIAGFFIIMLNPISFTIGENSSKQVHSIVGKWKIVQQTCPFLGLVKKNDIIIFNNNGKLVVISRNKKFKNRKINGTWKFTENNKNINLALNTDKENKNLPDVKSEIYGKLILSSAKVFKLEFQCSGLSMLCVAPTTTKLPILEFRKIE